MVSELTDRINALCEEKDRKKLTAAFVNDLLVQKGYLKEEEQDETRIRRVTEKALQREYAKRKDGQNLAAGIIMH